MGKHRRDIPGKMIIRSWKNFATRRRKKERERERATGREKEGECSGDEAAVSRDVTVARSFIVALFPRETVFIAPNCGLSLAVTPRASYETKFAKDVE